MRWEQDADRMAHDGGRECSRDRGTEEFCQQHPLRTILASSIRFLMIEIDHSLVILRPHELTSAKPLSASFCAPEGSTA